MSDGELGSEEDGAEGRFRRPPWDAVISTVLLELVGLALSGLLALAARPFGLLPDAGLIALGTTMVAIGPTIELYRAGPPGRWAAAAAFATLVTVTLLLAAAVNTAFPTLTDPNVGLLVGYLVGAPVGVAVLGWLLGRARTK